MHHPKYIYELLLDHCAGKSEVDNVLIGLVWTLCQGKAGGVGLAMSPGVPTRTLNWSGDLLGKSLTDLAEWILEWEPYQATVGMAAINASINSRPLPESVVIEPGEQANLAVFDYFLPQLLNRKVVVIGRYPGIERYQNLMRLGVLEKQPNGGDLPDQASEFLLIDADWVFITASSITNKTFPRLAELAENSITVLMGPTTPWLPQLHEFGINYLAGVEVLDPRVLYHTIAQGGGVRIFESALRYRIAKLTPKFGMAWLKREIADCYTEKQQLTQAMESWYGAAGNQRRFPGYAELERLNKRLARLDGSYKGLWDTNPGDRPV